jgi:AcrR family transcriptional regulator
MVASPTGELGEVLTVLTERDRQRAETRRRVRDAALTLIRKDGLGDTRIDAIARAVGMSRGTVYFHYPTKEDVVAEVLTEAETRISAAIRELPRSAAIGEALETFSKAFAKEWERDHELFPSAASVALRRAAETIRSTRRDEVLHALAIRFRLAADRNEITKTMRPPVLAHVFLVNVLAATLAWSTRPRPKLGAVLGDVVEVFLSGARARHQ